MKSSFAFIGLLILLASCLGDPGPSIQEILNSELATIDTYLDGKNINAYSDAAGIRYTIDSLGSGYPPKYGQSVAFDYSGMILAEPLPAPFQTAKNYKATIGNSLIIGFQIGLPLLPNGSKATLYVPASLAYGSQGTTTIPGNSNLVFKVKMRSIAVLTAEKTRRNTDTTAIDEYLTTAAIANVVKDTSGLRYVITQPGTGPKPGWFSKVKINFKGFIFTTSGKGGAINSGTNEPSAQFDSRVVQYLRGFQIGLQQMNEGSKATLYIPSGLGFGTQSGEAGAVIIPANSNLIYEIELLEVQLP